MPPHSATVRGTLSNPKTQSAIKNNEEPPQIGDPVSLASGKDDSKPHNSTSDSVSPANSYSENKQKGSQKQDLPHSKKVRGTLANEEGKKVDKTMLGDPVSLKTETNERGQDRGALDEQKGGKSKL
ncbi:hypothetical protein K491DRAFT_696415 [Lophiostoma macrostomum CBS 122681]|uniref:Uncharacterized protein n=1 Tax=Lophiostoma macrostomum CBS 122681 TaxID=1314788 RepID=A0A6A6SZ45_9PLEO|nr:hypothetical protein K491DRAFT_696415 [Lophiostoma macrostomum CBS 122681]